MLSVNFWKITARLASKDLEAGFTPSTSQAGTLAEIVKYIVENKPRKYFRAPRRHATLITDACRELPFAAWGYVWINSKGMTSIRAGVFDFATAYSSDINELELRTVAEAFQHYHEKDEAVLILCDNAAAVFTMRNQTSRFPHLLRWKQSIVAAAKTYRRSFYPVWIPSAANPVDALSRGLGISEEDVTTALRYAAIWQNTGIGGEGSEHSVLCVKKYEQRPEREVCQDVLSALSRFGFQIVGKKQT